LKAVKEFHELAQVAEDTETRINCLYGEILALIRSGRTHEARDLLKIARLFGNVDEAHARGDLIEIQLDSSEDRWDRVLLH
jgi:hypothetical protein